MNTSLSLDSLASAINAAHERCRLAYRTALDDAKSAGELLLQAKGQIPYGQWGNWIEQNCTFSDRTCQMYMQIAKHWQDIERSATVADLGVRAAIESIADKSAPEVINKKAQIDTTPSPRQLPKLNIRPGDRIKVTDPESPEYGQELEVSEFVQDAIAVCKKGNETYPLLVNQVEVVERATPPTLPDVKPNPAAQTRARAGDGRELPRLERPPRNLSSLSPLDLEEQAKNMARCGEVSSPPCRDNVATAYPMTSRTTQRSEGTAARFPPPGTGRLQASPEATSGELLLQAHSDAAPPVSSRAQRSKEVTVAALQDLLQRILDECGEYLPQELIDEARELL